MAKAEAWAISEGYERLTLNVFTGNERARKLYEELGFGADVVKYVKEI
jgi:RimJ/RimL family protein N-acetyltransferase